MRRRPGRTTGQRGANCCPAAVRDPVVDGSRQSNHYPRNQAADDATSAASIPVATMTTGDNRISSIRSRRRRRPATPTSVYSRYSWPEGLKSAKPRGPRAGRTSRPGDAVPVQNGGLLPRRLSARQTWYQTINLQASDRLGKAISRLTDVASRIESRHKRIGRIPC
jgi:hypothetical protein